MSSRIFLARRAGLGYHRGMQKHPVIAPDRAVDSGTGNVPPSLSSDAASSRDDGPADEARTALACARTLILTWRAPLASPHIPPELSRRLAGNYDGRHPLVVWLEDEVVHVEERPLLRRWVARLERDAPRGGEGCLRLRHRDNRFHWYRLAWMGQGARRNRCFTASLSRVDAVADAVREGEVRASRDFLRDACRMDRFCAQAWLLLHRDGEHAFVSFDLERFRYFNRQYGYDEGNALLRSVARLAHGVLRPDELLGHVAADRFVVCLLGGRERVEGFMHDLRTALRQGLPALPDLHVSFGIRLLASGEMGSVRLFCDQAREALKTVKGSYLREHAFYDAGLGQRLDHEQLVESNMGAALAQREFLPVFQPRVRLRDGVLAGAEVLARWQHGPTLRILPNNFVPLFERNGFIVRFDYYMWQSACRLLRQWLDAGLRPPRLSLNVSRIHFQETPLVEVLGNLLETHALSPSLLELEITESACADDAADLLPVMRRLHEMGFPLALDDFGAGYASVASLCRLPFDVLKLDKSLLDDCLNNARQRAVLRHVIPLGREMGMEVVAEGVESVEQANFLLDCGCELAQSFLFSRPLSAEVFRRRCLESDAPFLPGEAAGEDEPDGPDGRPPHPA